MKKDIKNIVQGTVKEAVKTFLMEGEVIDFKKFRKQKRDNEDYYNEVLVSKDGSFVFNPKDYVLVTLTHRDQADALVDGDLNKAEDLGAQILSLSIKNLQPIGA